jgi:GT2 family glycosyltransferase
MIPKIAVLITSHNRKQTTLKCLSNLYKQTGWNTQFLLSVYLVDDGSTDGTGAAVKEQFPMVNVIFGTGDLYWNRGMHLAWDTASKSNEDYDHFLWLNDDVVLYDFALEHLLFCGNKSHFKSIICGVFETTQGSNSICYGGGNFNGKTYIANSLHTEYLQSCVIINGNCVLVAKAVFEKVGMLDKIFPHALGDHDYSLRAKKMNIDSYTTQKIIGNCDKNASLPLWCLSSTPFLKRLKVLYSPLGNSHPYYYTIYMNRHFGLFRAFKNFITIHLRVVLPSLWK